MMNYFGRFLPPLARKALETVLERAGLKQTRQSTVSQKIKVAEDEVCIGNTVALKFKTDAKSKVPDIIFFDIPQVSRNLVTSSVLIEFVFCVT